MEIVPNSMTVAEFCESLGSGKIQVNWDYQRSDQVWPASAQSFLIESILLNFPIPKLFLHQKTDRVSRQTVYFIVDGQQRTTAIKAFYDGDLRLARTLDTDDAAGRTYDELPPELQDRFLAYGIGIDLFVNATEKTMREVFRRINSYEVPLNYEEQRHARWQGDFKWYIYHLSHNFDAYYDKLHTFSETQLVRMQDMKLLAEISHALINGITTTNKRSLDDLYENNDETFPQGEEFTTRIEDAVEFIGTLDAVHSTGLMKAYSLYSLVLAVIHAKRKVPALESAETRGGKGLASRRVCQQRLSVLAAAMEDEKPHKKLVPFVRATEKGTNVRAKRITRFKYFLDSVTRDGGALLPKQ
jgi:hypothetical protein